MIIIYYANSTKSWIEHRLPLTRWGPVLARPAAQCWCSWVPDPPTLQVSGRWCTAPSHPYVFGSYYASRKSWPILYGNSLYAQRLLGHIVLKSKSLEFQYDKNIDFNLFLGQIVSSYMMLVIFQVVRDINQSLIKWETDRDWEWNMENNNTHAW